MPIHLLQIAKKLAHDAGKMAIDIQSKGFEVHNKGSHLNMVTDADKAAEHLIVNTIKKNFPDHTIITEESETYEGNSEYKWIIDPIDGTTNFAHGLPFFGISIAVIKAGKPIIGVVEVPTLNESFWAQEGKGAYLNKTRLHVSKVPQIRDALMATGFPYERGKRYAKNMELFDALYKPCHGIRRFGAASVDLCYTAAGRFDAFWEYDLEAWDVAAGKIILEEAGGMITNMDGSKFDPKRKMLLASNGLIHSELLRVIKEHGGDTV